MSVCWDTCLPSCWGRISPFGFLCFFLGTYTPNGANVFCFLSSSALLPQPPRQCLGKQTLYRQCGFAYELYDGKVFMGIKKKTIMGHIVFNPLCTHKFKPDAFGDQRCEDGRCGRFSRKRILYTNLKSFREIHFNPGTLSIEIDVP